MIKKSMPHLIWVLGLLLMLGCTMQDESQPTEIMYFILIDRFVDGDLNNNGGDNSDSYLPYDGTNPEALKHYQGGDLAGITQSLDSLKSMGISMIWISPFLDNSNTDYVGWWPYHGYHPIDFMAVDEHFGTMDDLKTLVKRAHAIGLKVIFDMPFNQTAQDHPWIDDSTRQDWYHWDTDGKPFDITDWENQEQIERGELHGLPDLAQENIEVSDYLFDVSRFWIEETGCDGFRLDAVKHIPISFWEQYNRKIKAFAGPDFLLLGEVFWGDAEKIVPYADLGFDYLFDIPGYYAIRNTFNKGASIKGLSDFYQANEAQLPNAAFATLIDNHDVARFNVDLGENAWTKQRLALGWLMTAPGLPVIYAGTEIGLPGYPAKNSMGESQDYLNRISYPTLLDSDQTMKLEEFSKLTGLRHSHPALSNGVFKEIYKDWSIYAFVRLLGDDQLFICMNNASTQEFISIPKLPGLTIENLNNIYGGGVARVEGSELLLRLPANSLNVWEMDGKLSESFAHRVAFTNRLSGDYQLSTLFFVDIQRRIQSIQLAGDFNNWVPQDFHSYRQSDTIFIEIPLKAGHYQYKFVLNEETWIADPNAADFSIDPYGGRNSILSIP